MTHTYLEKYNMSERQGMFVLVVLCAACGPARGNFIATATSTGDEISPSTGIGTGSVLFNSATDTLTVALGFTGLTSPTAIQAGVPGAAHINLGPDPASNGPPIFPFTDPCAPSRERSVRADDARALLRKLGRHR
jgi:hypothetical protein